MATRIGFSTPRKFNPVSWLVRKFTGSRASHAFFIFWDVDFEMDLVMEAHEFGFRLIPLDHFSRRNKIVRLVIPKYAIDAGLKVVANRYLGSRYDYAGLIGMLVVQAGRWVHKKWKNPFRNAKYVFCSESIIIAMKESPGYEGLDLDNNSDPQALLDYFEDVEGV